MAKDKDKQVNPAAAALKKQKAAALKKGKAQVAAQRNERLANRNPDRLQRQIDELKNVETRGQLRPKDKQTLEGLERDLRMVKKARESLGEKAPSFGGKRDGGERRDSGTRDRGSRGGGVLGKRRRDGSGWKQHADEPESSETDEDAREIPMPTDLENEPPIPRKPRRPQNANDTPMGEPRLPHALPEKPPVKAQTVYESAPQIRNLQKEAVSRFVPAAVAAKRKLAQGQGRLMEPEEADRLERGGYLGTSTSKKPPQQSVDGMGDEEERFRREMDELETVAATEGAASEAFKEAQYLAMNDVAEGDDVEAATTKRLKQVELEEVEDEGDM